MAKACGWSTWVAGLARRAWRAIVWGLEWVGSGSVRNNQDVPQPGLADRRGWAGGKDTGGRCWKNTTKRRVCLQRMCVSTYTMYNVDGCLGTLVARWDGDQSDVAVAGACRVPVRKPTRRTRRGHERSPPGRWQGGEGKQTSDKHQPLETRPGTFGICSACSGIFLFGGPLANVHEVASAAPLLAGQSSHTVATLGFPVSEGLAWHGKHGLIWVYRRCW